jgi:hypothetical protein
MSKATRGRGAVIGLGAWLEQVVVERVKGIDEELVKRSCVGSAEWSVIRESSFTKDTSNIWRVWPAAAIRMVARCNTVCPWNGRQMTCPGMMKGSVALSNGAIRLHQRPSHAHTLRAVC